MRSAWLAWASEWLYQNGPVILIASIPGVLIAIITAWLNAAIKTRFEERRRVRREHLAAIQTRVLCPLRERLEDFYLPLLRGQLGPVIVDSLVRTVDGSITEPRRVREGRIAPRRLTDPPEYTLPVFGGQAVERSKLDPILYEDAKANHYRRLVQRLECFTEAVDRYTSRAAREAENLAARILDRSPLPVVTAAGWLNNKSWIDANGLAVWVLNWMLDATQSNPFTGSDGRSIQIDGHHLAQAETKGDVDTLLTELDALCREPGIADELQREAEPLAGHARELLDDLNALLATSRLPGGCRIARA